MPKMEALREDVKDVDPKDKDTKDKLDVFLMQAPWQQSLAFDKKKLTNGKH